MNDIDFIREQITKRIISKTSPSSISRVDVADLLNLILDRSLLPLLTPQKTYKLGFLGRDDENNLYVSIQNNIIGDYNNAAFWKKLSNTTVDGNLFEESVVINTNGQTSFNLTGIPLDASKVDLFLNGQRLKKGIDFTATSLGLIDYYGDVKLLTIMNLTAIYRT